MTNGDKIKVHERITRVETKLDGVCSDVKSIKNNHLKDIRKDIAGFKETTNEKFANIKTWLISLLVAVILTLIATVIRMVM